MWTKVQKGSHRSAEIFFRDIFRVPDDCASRVVEKLDCMLSSTAQVKLTKDSRGRVLQVIRKVDPKEGRVVYVEVSLNIQKGGIVPQLSHLAIEWRADS